MEIAPVSEVSPESGRRQAVSGSRKRVNSFDTALQFATNRYTVRAGDTLSEIVLDRLRGNGAGRSTADVYRAVDRVAAHNGLADPDRIHVGQQLDLSVLNAGGTTDSKGLGADPRAEAPRGSAIDGAAARYILRDRISGRIIDGDARVTSTYGMRRDPIRGDMRYHRGIDIAAQRGTPIVPIDIGIVVFAGQHGGHGKTVVVRHPNGMESLYGHASELLVREGDSVHPGEAIAEVGSTGRSTGPHVHFEVREDGQPINPDRYRRGSGASFNVSERF